MSIGKFCSTFEYKLIYVFRINDKEHAGCVKVGDATIHSDKPYTDLFPNSHDLNHAARQRIDSYTATAGVVYELLYTEIAVYADDKGKLKAFRDYKVHNVLKRSGIASKYFATNKTQNEWFVTDLNTAMAAIKAVKQGKTALNSAQISTDKNPIIFRPEQLEAIKKTINRYKTDTKMLWNAKMRFGKTLTALQVAKDMGFKKTIIITHRPVVSKGWFEDFEKIFYDRKDYSFGSKINGKTIQDLLSSGDNFVYFASMQDLRGSDAVGGNFDKNNEIFKIDWDLVVVDEAHEGTKTELGKNVLKAVIKEENEHKTYVLELSGTPFNLLTDFEQESIYTWDYIMEQEAKTTWDQTHFGDSNPYEELPRMNIYTYHLEKSLPVYVDVMDKAFNFKEFFRLWTGDIKKDGKPRPQGVAIGDFVHENDVKAFLDLICRKDDKTNYPFATQEYQNYFRHSLWVVPGVKEAKALSSLLKKHHVFRNFTIVNVAGDGDEEIDTNDALNAVKNAMTDNPNDTYTITLSCGRLTTGVSVPEWTAVLMLAGTYSTAASQYLQTIFRVQTPANINGKIKEECYVFDFAPDRTLKMVAESVQLSARAGSKNVVAELALAKFLNFCPVIAISESNMKEYKVSELLQELKKAYAERVARNGFDDPKIYNDELLKLTEVELQEFENLKKIVGESKQTKKAKDIDINNEGFTDAETEEEKELKKKSKNELTEEDKARLAELKEKRKNRDSAISILRAISIRMPLLVYGMDIDIDTDVTIDNFADLMTDDGPNPNASWYEFMPKGVTKEIFKKFAKYYDKDIFVAASRRIRFIAKTADELEPTERVQKIASLFATFKNPDKETVLTPWRVVNLHMSSAIGGWNFFDDSFTDTLNEGPIYVEHTPQTKEVFDKNAKLLEINSKTGLYPLYLTYTLYRNAINEYSNPAFEEKQIIWDRVVKDQVYVICKTPMAKLITRRTLLGYRNGKTNMHAFDDLIMQLREKPDKFIDKVLSKSFWNLGGTDKMKFNAVVGNPPYQEESANNNKKLPIYNYFWDASKGLSSFVSLITPARFLFNTGQTPKEWNKKMLNDKHLKLIKYFEDCKDVFPTAEIKGGVCICNWEKNKEYKPIVEFLPDQMLQKIASHFTKDESNNLSSIIYGGRSDLKFNEKFLKQYPNSVQDRIKAIQIKHPNVTALSPNEEYELKSSTFVVLPYVFKDKKPTDSEQYYQILGLINSKRVLRWIETKYMTPRYPTNNNLQRYKVFVAESNGAGTFGETLSTPIVGGPFETTTPTFISVGNFETKEEASNLLKYLKTKFARALLSLCKKTQHNPSSSWAYVPLQDFSNKSDIDWSKSIEEIDNQFFKKYSLSEEEISFIKENVLEMK